MKKMGIKIRRILKILFCCLVFLPAAINSAQIKQGTVINSENYKKYLPELKKLLSPGTYICVERGLERGYLTIPVVETKKYLFPKHQNASTMKYHALCKIGPNKELLGYKAGMPFPYYKSPLELAYNLSKYSITTDQVTFTAPFQLFSRGEKERTFKWLYHNLYYNGRVMLPPLPEFPDNKDNIRMKECFVVTYPFDVKGFAMIRTRYEDLGRDDDCYSYIPALRRIRRLTGADTTDAVLGSDTQLDDFEFCRRKIIPTKQEYKMGQQMALVPSHYIKKDIKTMVTGNCINSNWEIRPVSVLEMIEKDESYTYSKRVLYLEKERLTYSGYMHDTYDQAGRLCRSQNLIINAMLPKIYDADCWKIGTYNDLLKDHNTILGPWDYIFEPDPGITFKTFTFKDLLRKAR